MFITFLLFTLIFISYSTYFQLISWTYGNSLQIDDWVKVKVKVWKNKETGAPFSCTQLLNIKRKQEQLSSQPPPPFHLP